MDSTKSQDWTEPPLGEVCADIPIKAVVKQNDSAVVFLERIRKYSTGLVFDLTLAARLSRQGRGPSGSRDDLRDLFGNDRERSPVFTVRCTDGAMANSIDGARVRIQRQAHRGVEPEPPIVVGITGSGASMRQGVLQLQQSIWLSLGAKQIEPVALEVDWLPYGIEGAAYMFDWDNLHSFPQEPFSLWAD